MVTAPSPPGWVRGLLSTQPRVRSQSSRTSSALFRSFQPRAATERSTRARSAMMATPRATTVATPRVSPSAPVRARQENPHSAAAGGRVASAILLPLPGPNPPAIAVSGSAGAAQECVTARPTRARPSSPTAIVIDSTNAPATLRIPAPGKRIKSVTTRAGSTTPLRRLMIRWIVAARERSAATTPQSSQPGPLPSSRASRGAGI